MKNFKLSRMAVKVWLSMIPLTAAVSCEEKGTPDTAVTVPELTLSELAGVFSCLHLEQEHLDEVHSAVSSSAEHGYDEEYTMSMLFSSPGAGVGSDEEETKAASSSWDRPLRALLEDYFESSYATRAGDSDIAQECIAALEHSDAQIYWPYSENWDGHTYPVITYDPGTEALANVGFALSPDGRVERVTVTEEMAKERPVWVMNSNEDSEFMTLEMLRRKDPDWGQGGSITVTPQTKAGEDPSLRTLILKDFQARRNFDCWFAGASEYWIKTGILENFTASTEAELRLYSPTITDFMIVVRRYETGIRLPFNAVLVSDWTDQVDNMAFMIVEDDGGTRTTWNCSATVKVQSKSYGFDISLPFNSHDDIVWRGMLSRRYFESYKDTEGHFGDVYLTFAII